MEFFTHEAPESPFENRANNKPAEDTNELEETFGLPSNEWIETHASEVDRLRWLEFIQQLIIFSFFGLHKYGKYIYLT